MSDEEKATVVRRFSNEELMLCNEALFLLQADVQSRFHSANIQFKDESRLFAADKERCRVAMIEFDKKLALIGVLREKIKDVVIGEP